MPGKTPQLRVVRIMRPRVPDHEKMMQMPIDVGIRLAEPYLTPSLRAQLLKEFNGYLGRREHPALLGNRFADFLYANCLADRPVEEVHRLIGSAIHAMYVETPVIKVMAAALRRASIEWVLCGLPRNLAASTNFGSYEMAELGPRHWRFTLDDYPGYPGLLQGFFEAGAANLQNDTQYRYTIVNSHCCYFDITWTIGRLS